MCIFKQILEDEEIVNLYAKIYKLEDEWGNWAHHGLDHVLNVTKLVEVLLSKFGYDNEFIEEAKVAALLHDVGVTEGKEGHALRSYNYVKDYFKRKNIKLKNEELVLDAIKIHSDGFDTENIIALTLILSDKLDIKYTRMAKAGYDVPGMRQIQYIDDIILNIDNNKLVIDFKFDEKINKKELEEYYFITKVFKAIISFSKKMNLEPVVRYNENIWEAFEDVRRSM